jgi:peptidoglycan/LPS O-acetylase OafA/YrhL
VRSKNIAYLPAVDHIRGFAALLILFYHGVTLISYELIHAQPFTFEHWLSATNVLTAPIIEGHSAVALFMVLSGFIFTVGTYGQEIRYTAFIKNRLLRTYPLFLLMLFVGISAFPERFELSSFLQTLFFLGNTNGALSAGNFTTMFWAVAVEWQFYLVFPFLLTVTNNSGARVLIAMILVFILLRCFAYLEGALIRDLSYWTIIGRMDQFLIGMLSAILYLRHFRQGRLFDLVFVAALAGVLVILYFFNRAGGWPENSAWKIVWPTIEAMIWAPFILGYLSIARRVPAGISRLFSSLGVISYSIYLIHFLLVDLCIRQEWALTIFESRPVLNAFLTTAVIILPLVLIISSLTYYAIERPFLALRVKYKTGRSGQL